MSLADAELRRLFVDELSRHRETIADGGADVEAKRRALHALKGAAGLIGETNLADALTRLERRVRAGDLGALEVAVTLLARAELALQAGKSALESTWPTPPADLVARAVEGPLRATYTAEMRDRVARIDAALASRVAPEEALGLALREMHAMKGAATAAKDEATAWFCHGMEAHLRSGRAGGEVASAVLRDLASFRAVLLEMAVDPIRALARLGGEPAPPVAPSSGKQPVAARRSTRPPPTEDDETNDGTVRIPAAALDRLVERASHLGRLSAQIGAGVDQSRVASRRLRELAPLLAEALRLIGPPRPWGAPAAALARVQRAAASATSIADELEFGAAAVRDRTDDLGADIATTANELRTLRRARAGWLLDRVRAAVETQARLSAVALVVVVEGAELSVDRRLLEQLVDPVLQVAMNALAHGVEPPEERARRGKPREGSLRLAATYGEGRLRLVIADDGAGVDVALVRRRALESGVVPAEVAEAADDAALLDLLFLPGFTTRREADLLAGRGMGLDLTASALRRLGGSLKLASHRGRGVTATIDVPLDGGSSSVLWVTAAGRAFAVQAESVLRVVLPEACPDAVTLAAILGDASVTTPRYALELRAGLRSLTIGVDDVGSIEDVALRPLSPLVRGAGPYLGAVVRSSGEVELILDSAALAELA